MSKQRFTVEEIIHTLREADVLIGQGKTTAEACKVLGVTDNTYFRSSRVPVQISREFGAQQIRVTDGAACAVSFAGAVWCWGGRLFTPNPAY